MVSKKSERKAGKILGRGLVALAAAGITLLAAEAGTRLVQFSITSDRHPASPGWNHPRYLVMSDAQYHYTLRPFFEGRQINPYGDFDVPVLIDSQGLRNNERTFTVDPSRTRILMLGDSFTFGEGVTFEQAYPELVEDLLNTKYGQSVQVHNAGVPGYSLSQEAGRLEGLLPVINPGLVTVAWLPWESLREIAPMEVVDGWLVPAEDKPLVYRRGDHIFLSSYPPGTWRAEADVWAQSHSLLYFFLRKRLLIYLSGNPSTEWFAERGRVEVDPEVLEKPLITLDGMARLCRRHQARMVLVMIGAPPQTAKNIAEFCHMAGIESVSLAENMDYPESPYQKYLFRHDGHFNAAGHEYLSESLAPKLAEVLRKSSP